MPGDYSRKSLDRKKHYSGVLMQQGRVQLDADWNEQLDISLYRTQTETVDMIGPSGGPSGRDGFNISVAPNDLSISAGRFYVDGLLCELDQPASYTNQPFYPNPDFTVQVSSPPGSPPQGAQLRLKDGVYVVYLDAWLREVTYREDPLIRERALDGPDTATRLQTVWQVKILTVSHTVSSPPGSPPVSACDLSYPEFDQLTAPGLGRMNAKTQADEKKEPCQLPPSAGFFGLENQLYRVEIQKAGDQNTATFKWSRENASVETSIISVSGNKVIVSDFGRDDVLGFAGGQWVEIVDDESSLNSSPRALVQIDHIEPGNSAVILKTPVSLPANSQNPRLRRWDQSGPSADSGGVKANGGTWIPLENGIQVNFGNGAYRSGDYWLIPARTAGAEIEWPPFEIPNNNPVPQPPLGIRHHYCRLAVLEVKSGGIVALQDCRKIFPALINFPPIDRGMHVVGLQTVDSNNVASPLLNDTNVQVSSFAGIDVHCDASVDPASISRPTCFVTVEFPVNVGLAAIDSYIPLVLAGTVTSTGNTISWRAAPQAMISLSQTILNAVTERGLLIRLNLKGNFIWSLKDPELFLDGEAFGQPLPGGVSSLRLPSGDRRRGGNFETWFWLVGAPSFITDMQAAPSSTIIVGDTATVTMTLSAPAPQNSVIALVISNANVTVDPAAHASSPPTSPPTFVALVPVQTGSRSAQFTATGRVPGQTNIQASFNGQTAALTLVVTPPPPPPQLTGSLVLSPFSIREGGVSRGTFTLTGPAPKGGVLVQIGSDNTDVAQLDSATVTVPAGSNTPAQPFVIRGISAGQATISAQAGGVTLKAVLHVTRKVKDGKDGKDGKEGKERGKELEKAIAREIAGVGTKLRDAVVSNRLVPAPPNLAAVSSPAPAGQAFIRADERPPVGETVLNAAPETTPEAAPAAAGTSPAPARPKDKRAVAPAAPKRKPKSTDKRAAPEKGTIVENIASRPV